MHEKGGGGAVNQIYKGLPKDFYEGRGSEGVYDQNV